MGEPANPPICRFYRLIDGAPEPTRADRTADGTLPINAVRYCEPIASASGFGWYLYPPLNFSLIAIALNTVLVLSLVLIFGMGIVGIAAATGVTAWLNVGMLAWGLHRRGLLGFDDRLKRVLPRIVFVDCK